MPGERAGRALFRPGRLRKKFASRAGCYGGLGAGDCCPLTVAGTARSLRSPQNDFPLLFSSPVPISSLLSSLFSLLSSLLSLSLSLSLPSLFSSSSTFALFQTLHYTPHVLNFWVYSSGNAGCVGSIKVPGASISLKGLGCKTGQATVRVKPVRNHRSVANKSRTVTTINCASSCCRARG